MFKVLRVTFAAVMLLCGVLLAPVHAQLPDWAADNKTFQQWYLTRTKLIDKEKKHLKDVANKNVSIAYDAVRTDLIALAGQRGLSASEQDRVRTMLDGLAQAWPAPTMLEGATPGEQSVDDWGDREINIASLKLEAPSQEHQARYQLKAGGKSIDITPDHSESVAKVLTVKVLALKTVLDEEQGKPAREASNAEINASKARWDAFLKNATEGQYPWETVLNGHFVKGSLRYPPRKQVRVGHLQGVSVVNADSHGTVTPNVAVEVLGYQRLKEETYAPAWSASVVLVPDASADEGWGRGLMLTLKNFSAGVIWQDRAGVSNSVAVVLGLDLVQYFENTDNPLAKKAYKGLGFSNSAGAGEGN